MTITLKCRTFFFYCFHHDRVMLFLSLWRAFIVFHFLKYFQVDFKGGLSGGERKDLTYKLR